MLKREDNDSDVNGTGYAEENFILIKLRYSSTCFAKKWILLHFGRLLLI